MDDLILQKLSKMDPEDAHAVLEYALKNELSLETLTERLAYGLIRFAG